MRASDWSRREIDQKYYKQNKKYIISLFKLISKTTKATKKQNFS